MSVLYTIRCTTQAWSSMGMHTPWYQRVLGHHQVAHFLSIFFADSVTLPWIGWCHPYWLMKYRKILRHRYQYLKYCSTYEQHSITCVHEKHGNMDIYFTGLTNWTINVVWMNSKVPIPKFDNSSQYDKHILIHAIGKYINNYDNVIKCVP